MASETQSLLDLNFFPPGTIPPEAQQQSLDFWGAEGAIPTEVAAKRVLQVIGHASIDGQLVGIASGLVGLSKNLMQPYFFYRSYIAAGARRNGFGKALLRFSFDHLSDYFKAQPRPEVIGVLLEIPADLAPLDPHLVWPDSQFVFAGKLQNGVHQRVRYFEQVRMFEQAQ